MNTIYRIIFLVLLVCANQLVKAQAFPKNIKCKPWWWIEVGQGYNQSQNGDKLYLGTFQAIPSWTIPRKKNPNEEPKPGWLRAGIVVGFFYQGSKIGFLSGPRLTVKLKDVDTLLTAPLANIQLFSEYLVGTHSEAVNAGGRGWLGGGVGIELNNFVTLSIKVHRDVIQPITYTQFGIAYLIRPKEDKTGSIIVQDDTKPIEIKKD